ncbi:MAG: hypothetical protein E7294_09720 [Lachnospiraceae bacterium]|nr:hypothetical protein [Lachnospiraceae bacterium]
MKKVRAKRLITGIMSAALVTGSLPYNGFTATTQAKEVLPEPAYEYTFENVMDKTVDNSGTASVTADSPDDTDAVMGGSGDVSVIYDEERGSDVLSLPGGSVGAGYLSLPQDLFKGVEDAFTISFWVKADTVSNTHYNRIFEASSTELGKYEKGISNDWVDPEFTMVVGGTDSASTRYDFCVNTADKTKARVELGQPLGNGAWSYLTASVTKDGFTVYMNGKPITATDLTNNTAATLAKFFDEMDTFRYSALGRSVYTSDKDTCALYDDFRFYNMALSAQQVSAIYVEEYGQVIDETDGYESEPTLSFDLDKQTTEVFHGSTGFLYGISEVNVPSTEMVSAIAPKLLVQKAADGKQHPSGDAYRLTNYLTSNGVESIQVYLQDYYLEWPYEYNGINDYNEKVESIVTKMTEGKTKEEKARYSYVLFNEPDGIWYNPMNSTNIQSFCKDWLQIYNTVKDIDPFAKVAGPNFSVYNQTYYRTFFDFCKKNGCLPEIITWHDLQKDKLVNFATEYKQIKDMVTTYYAGSDIEPMFFVNETANFEDVGAPGPLVNWLAIYDEKDTYASLPYWGLANSLNELAAGANKPNGGWWVYRFYAQMRGKKTEMTKENVQTPSSAKKGDTLYGLTSIDEENKTVYSLFGGHDGTQVIRFKNLKEQASFAGAKSAHVKLYRSKYTGHQGFAYEAPVVFEGEIAFNNAGTLSLILEDCDLLDAYFALITPSESEKTMNISDYEAKWSATYEAEEATLLGNAKAVSRTGGSDLARSNRSDVENIFSEKDGVKYNVEVPKDGIYEAQVYYSVAAPFVNAVTLVEDASGQNRAIGRVVHNKLVVDDDESTAQILEYKSTVKSGYYNYESVKLSLKAGKHTITVTHYGDDQTNVPGSIRKVASQDKLDLISVQQDVAGSEVEFEEAINGSYGYDNTVSGYHGGGAVKGSGENTVYVVVREDGLYDTSLFYAGTTQGTLSVSKIGFDYGKDATAQAEVGKKQIPLTDLATKNDQNIIREAELGRIYLTAGVNAIVFDSTEPIVLDKVTFVKDERITQEAATVIEAEAGSLSGDVTKTETVQASRGVVVDGIGGGKADNTLTMKVKVAQKGNYKLSMYYTNDEPAPVMKRKDGSNYVHPYNTDLVERYAQVIVNGKEPETVYFRNTLSWEVVENVIMDVELDAGENTIVFANDNSYKFSEVVDDHAPRFDKFEITRAFVEKNYTPAVNDETIYKALVSVESLKRGDYTNDSYDVFESAREKLQALEGTNASEETILAAIEEVRQAEKALVSFAPLKAQIREAEAVDAALYTKRSYRIYKNVIKKAKKLMEEKEVSAKEIEDGIRELKEAAELLVEVYEPIDNSTGKITSSAPGTNTHPEYAWDGDASTHPDLVTASGGWDASAAWTAIEYPEPVTFTRLSYSGRSGYYDRLVGGTFEYSMDGSQWQLLYKITSAPADGAAYVDFDEPVELKYLRYNAPANAYLNICTILLANESEDEPAVVTEAIDKMEALADSTITLESAQEVKAAQEAYNALTDAQKAYVPKETLEAFKTAEALYRSIKAADDQKKAAEQAAQKAAQEAAKKPLAKGTLQTVGGAVYIVTGAEISSPEVSFRQAVDKNVKKLSVPASIVINGITYRVSGIADNAFKGNKKLKSVSLPVNITTIGKNAFNGCTALKSITIPQKVVSIGANAFKGDKNLKKITVKSTVLKKVGKNALKGIHAKAVIKVPGKQKKSYEKLFKKKGQTTTVKIK